MAIVAAICNSYKQEILSGTHSSADVYKIALYTSAATIGATTTTYATTNEVAGTGYVAGGQACQGYAVALVNGVAILDFTTDPAWAASSITARGALIYNSSKGNAAVAVLDFGADVVSTADTFTVVLPAATDVAGLVRVA